MQSKDNNIKTFFELVRAGLWEKEARLLPFGKVYYEEVMCLAEEQSVVGLVAAGLGHVSDIKVPKEELLQFVGLSLRLEQQNKDMNVFLANLVEKMRSAGIYTLLVKGQGVAQCYEKPLWRACGDIDLLLDEENYNKAKERIAPIADEVASENEKNKHQAYVIRGFDVELHGGMPFRMAERVDKEIDEVMKDRFIGGNVSSWEDGDTTVFVPVPGNHIIFVFTHFLHHFYIEGVGLRQICDWCRLLWTYREELDVCLLEKRIRKMGLMTEWQAFGALAVNTLGMPEEAMPFYDSRFTAKGEKILKRVLKSGNFGHNNDLSYRVKYTGISYKMIAMWRRFVDFASLIPVFPIDAPKFFVNYVVGKV